MKRGNGGKERKGAKGINEGRRSRFASLTEVSRSQNDPGDDEIEEGTEVRRDKERRGARTEESGYKHSETEEGWMNFGTRGPRRTNDNDERMTGEQARHAGGFRGGSGKKRGAGDHTIQLGTKNESGKREEGETTEGGKQFRMDPCPTDGGGDDDGDAPQLTPSSSLNMSLLRKLSKSRPANMSSVPPATFVVLNCNASPPPPGAETEMLPPSPFGSPWFGSGASA